MIENYPKVFTINYVKPFCYRRQYVRNFSRVAFKRKPVKPTRYKTWGAWVCGNNAKNLEEKGKRGRRACELALTMIVKIFSQMFWFSKTNIPITIIISKRLPSFYQTKSHFCNHSKIDIEPAWTKMLLFFETSFLRWRKMCKNQNIWVSIVKLKYLASQAAEWTPACEHWHAPPCWTVAIDKV